MSNQKNAPHNLSEAVHRLESAANGGLRASTTNGGVAEDLENIKRAIDELKPHLNQLKDDVAQAASETVQDTVRRAKESIKKGQDAVKDLGSEVDLKVHEHPWMAIGVVGLIAFLIGFLIGRKD